MPDLTPKQKQFCEEYLIDSDRFNTYLDKACGEDACWNWKGTKDKLGYGRFHIGLTHNSNMLVHRIAYGLATGELPEAVCHKCDNPSCCNPSHLFGGTRDDNNKDMARKGRHFLKVHPECSLKGERHGAAKLSNQAIIKIRERYAKGGITQYQIADEYKVSQRTIAKVIHKISWSHV